MVRVPYDGARIAVLVLRLVEGAHPVSVRKIYEPHECDERGVPLGWDQCIVCLPHKPGRVEDKSAQRPGQPTADVFMLKDCPTCQGHGSIKAAVLAECRYFQIQPALLGSDTDTARSIARTEPARCKGCGHPMSEGLPRGGWEGGWEGASAWDEDQAEDYAARVMAMVARGGSTWDVHKSPIPWSPCDRGCHHQPSRLRWWIPDSGWKHGDLDLGDETLGAYIQRVANRDRIQASWRNVDLRVGANARANGYDFILGERLVIRPFDLRPVNVAIMCQRCWTGAPTS